MNTRQLRVDYNNKWPEKFEFSIESEFLTLLEKNGIKQALTLVKLNLSEEYQFQFYLGYLLDALDMLPLRPDLAFDHVWKALDSEFFIIQQELGDKNCSRFDGFVDKVLNDHNTAATFLQYLKLTPYQTCEYAAKRVIEASTETDDHATTLFKRAKNSLGKDFILKFVQKYQPASNGKPSPSDQRKAGRLLKLVFSGKEVELDGAKFQISEKQLAIFLVKVVLANSRNKRFHGGVFPPFRSSVAKMETYAHAYFLLHISYGLLLDVFLYREYDVTSLSSVNSTMSDNAGFFRLLFGHLK
tara:strand:+ start:2135 stop:3031 length:897 start_codon:yes stop_codon:yes gene_type:complete